MRTTLLRRDLRRYLEEDRTDQDRTSRSIIPPGLRARGEVIAQARGVVSGLVPAQELARLLHLRVQTTARDGERVRPGRIVLRLEGEARSILAGERTLLNLLMHLSGVATATDAAVRAARRGSSRAIVAATRKTLPGLRDLEKAAVVHGGGVPHRRDLSDALLIKNNHLALVPLGRAIELARRASPELPLIVEARTEREALQAVRARVGRVLLDNLRAAQVARIARTLARAGLRRRVVLEVSGGLTARNVTRYFRAGADVASLGCLTHSAPALPFHLRVQAMRRRG